MLTGCGAQADGGVDGAGVVSQREQVAHLKELVGHAFAAAQSNAFVRSLVGKVKKETKRKQKSE